MKWWTWLAMVAATGACSFPTSEFTLGGTAPADVPAVDSGAVDVPAVDVPVVTDLGGLDVPAVTDVGNADVSDAGVADVWVDVTDAGPTDTGPAVDSGCPAGRVLCAGACVDPLNDGAHCGRCNYACNNTNATATCVEGRCDTNCRAGFADCDTDPRNGCEVGLGTITNCRSCGDVCPAGAMLNGAPACTGNVCRTVCGVGFGDCNSSPIDGCETPLSSSANCGSCGRTCVTGQSCTAGACVTGCALPNLMCGTACIDPQTSAANCGACGRVCTNPPNAVGACRAGVCGIGTCNAGFADCNGMVADGCETPLNTITNCGMCGRACAFPNGVAACTAGACALTGCSARNFRDCDANATTGCERDTSLDTTNCGACGVVCRSHVGSSTPCTAGLCAPVCNPGYGDCDRDPNNGCEVSLGTGANCGACGRACGTSAVCRGGTCFPTLGVVTYAVSPRGPAFVDACAVLGSGRLVPSTDDNGVLTPLPFAFSYWGSSIAAGSMINVSTNGFISLDGAINGALQGIVPDPAVSNGTIAAWWTDLFTSTTGVCTATVGLAPARRFIVQWSAVTYFGNRTADMNFEIVLNEGTNAVDLVYQRLVAPPPGYVPTVGIENLAGNQGVFQCTTASQSCGIAAGNSFRYTPM